MTQMLRHKRGQGLSFAQAEEDLASFESLLAMHRIRIAPNSPLEAAVLSILEYLELHRGTLSLPPTTDRRDAWLRMLGLVDLARKLLRVRDNIDFPKLLPHLRELGNDASDPSQFAKTDGTDQANHKTFELLVASASMTFGTDLRLESPRSNDTDTPDVSVTFDGVRWGIACKVLHSPKPTTYRDRIIEAIDQIDRAHIDRGIVLLNAKHMLPLDVLMPFAAQSLDQPYEVFENDDAPMRRLAQFKETVRGHAALNALNIAERCAASARAPEVAHYIPGMFFVRREGQSRMAPFVFLYGLAFAPVPEPLRAQTDRFMRALSAGLAFGAGT